MFLNVLGKKVVARILGSLLEALFGYFHLVSVKIGGKSSVTDLPSARTRGEWPLGAERPIPRLLAPFIVSWWR